MSVPQQKLPWFLAGALCALLLVWAAWLTHGLTMGRGPVSSPLRAEDVRHAVMPSDGAAPMHHAQAGGRDAAAMDATPVLGVASVLSAIVRVYGPSAAGSGVVISADGLLLTNAHVVGNALEAPVVVGGRTMAAQVLHADLKPDLALLRLPAGSYAFAQLGASADAQPGAPVTVAGYPLNLEGAPSLTSGIVSRYVREPHNERELLQTDAGINLGNSGGPVVDDGGRVVGIVTSFLGDHESLPARGIGFAVGVDSVKEWLSGLPPRR